ncbi:unnamed protein product [Caenorhabditis angaria]|uniref:Uncharacterized protein n=1 Tax=Caenorhabditis angaria TaxID=860376 RepID=A0A9P1IKM9_9PELO|nr:unnamed protein product [Caenorhabditis angaria]
MGFGRAMKSVRKKYRMHTASKIILALVGIGHLVLGIYTAVHLGEEQDAAAPIKAALAQHGKKGYTDSNSQVKGVFMPFFVALFCVVAAIMPYNGVLYFLFFLTLLEIAGFAWEMVAVDKINEHQHGHYALVIAVAKQVQTEGEKPTTPGRIRKKRFVGAIFAAVTAALPFIDKITTFIADAGTFVATTIKTIAPHLVSTINRLFTKQESEGLVKTIIHNKDLLRQYATLAECLETSKLLSEIGLGASIVTAVLLIAMLIFYTWDYRKSQSMMTSPHHSPHHSNPSPHRSPHHQKYTSSNNETGTTTSPTPGVKSPYTMF